MVNTTTGSCVGEWYAGHIVHTCRSSSYTLTSKPSVLILGEARGIVKDYILRYIDEGKLRSTTPKERGIARREYLALRRTEAFKTWERMQYKRTQRRKCFYCRERIYKGKYHVDHRIPINMGGLSNYSNLCLSCIPCNLAKSGDKIWKANHLVKLRSAVARKSHY